MRVDLPVARLERGRDIPTVCVPHVRKAVAHHPVTFEALPPWPFLAFLAIPVAVVLALHALGFPKAAITIFFLGTAAPAFLFGRNWPSLTIKNWPVCDLCLQRGRRLIARHEIGWLIFAVFGVLSIIAAANGGWVLFELAFPLTLVGLALTVGRRPLARSRRSTSTYVGGHGSGYLTRDGRTLRLRGVSAEFVEAVRHQRHGTWHEKRENDVPEASG